MTEEFKKARDEHLEKMWLEIEPFGFDHPDTYDFIKDRMDWAYEWLRDWRKNQVKEMYDWKGKAIKQQAIIDRLKEALERGSAKLIFASKGSTFLHMEAALELMQEALADVKKIENKGE